MVDNKVLIEVDGSTKMITVWKLQNWNDNF